MLALVGTGMVASTAAGAGSGPGSTLVAVAGGPDHLPAGARVVGVLPSGSALSVAVALRPADPAALEAFDEAVTSPASPLFHHFLAPGEFGTRFGPGAGVIAATRAWLEGEGLVVGPTAGDGLTIAVSGSALTLGRAFRVGFERDRLPSGRVVREPTARPEIPSALARSVEGVVGLDDLSLSRPQTERPPPGSRSTVAPATAAPATSSGPSRCHEPGATATDLAEAYSMSSLYPADEGQGVTVGLYELEPYLPSDVAAFESCYSPAPSPLITPVSVDGAAPTSGPGSGEAALDIEMVAGLAPEANIDVYVGQNFGVGPLDVYTAMIDQDTAQVLSTSWGECEADTGTAEIDLESTLFQQAAAQGQSFLAAAGDEGSEDCNVPGFSDDTALQVDDPASEPWVTAVGGTDLGAVGPPPGESVWNTGPFEGTTGGGNSATWTMPAWQLGPGVESGFTKADDAYSGVPPCPQSAGPGTVSCREVPDVVSDGDPNAGFAAFWNGGWHMIGGTSMGAPLWASIAALADQSAGGPARLGLLNPALYQAGCLSARPFNDITAGNNQPLGSPPSDPPPTPDGPDFPATAGYDLASGLGSPVASALLPDLVAPVDACPTVTGMDVRSGPSDGGTVVTVTGTNLGAVDEVDFGVGHPGAILAVAASSVTVRTPGSPTGGWDEAEVVVKTANDAIGFDGRNYFTFTGLRGYWTTSSDGGVFSFGQFGFHQSVGGADLQKPVVGMAATPSSQGYWQVASDGGVFAFGDARFFGSMVAVHLDEPVVGMTATANGGGYRLVAADGGVFAFGDARFYGSLGDHRLTAPIVAMAATPDGGGYWLVASNGGVFAFGDANFYGSLGNLRLDKPIVAMAATPDGGGYWLAASDGGVFAFGDAAFDGSLGEVRLSRPIVGMAIPFGGGGYWLVAADGGIFAFGHAGFAGSLGGRHLDAPMVGMGGS